MISDDIHFLDDTVLIGTVELMQVCGLTSEELDELADAALIAASGSGAARQYSARLLHVGRRAARVRAAFELDAAALMLVASLLARIDELEARLREAERFVSR